MVPTPAIRNLIREDKIHQIYSSMQTGQEKLGMQTLNQCLATLYMNRQITMETAITASSNKDELQEMIHRGTGVVAGAGVGTCAALEEVAGGRGCQPPARTRCPISPLPVEHVVARSSAASGWPIRWTPRSSMLRRERILVTKISAVKEKPKTDGQGKLRVGRKVPSKSLAVFTRQFSVMIDAGLPLVQCLDILGRQEPHKGFSATILHDAFRRRGRRVARRRDAAAAEVVRRALRQHGGGG